MIILPLRLLAQMCGLPSGGRRCCGARLCAYGDELPWSRGAGDSPPTFRSPCLHVCRRSDEVLDMVFTLISKSGL